MRSCLATLALVVASTLPSVAPADTPAQAAQVAAIDAACAARSDRALVRAPERFARIFGDPTTTPSDWRVLDDVTRTRIATDPNIYSEVADVWSDASDVAVVNLESRSLEFREHASYCFRADGSLARVDTTSSGTLNIDDEARYFDEAGTLVAQSSRMRLLFARGDATVSPDLRPAQVTIFATSRELPFYALMTATAPERSSEPHP